MKYKLRIAGIALLAMAAAPAWALQLGQIEVKSALNQPLVASIPLHPDNLSELQGLTVGLASSDDFARAGLELTSTDRTLRFHVVSDNNGQRLILVTSSEPITDPYLDFLVQVNTRRGKQLREFVVLLNPVIAAPAPAVQTAPVVRAPAAPPSAAKLPSPPPVQPPPEVQPEPQAETQTSTTAEPQPVQQAEKPAQPEPRAQPETEKALQAEPQAATPAEPVAPKPAAPPPMAAAPAQDNGQIQVQRGDTLYNIANQARQGSDTSINQMMLALQSANPEAFFKDNINDLRAGAILRIPTREEIDRNTLAEARAEVHRQYEQWRAAKTRPATVVEGAAAEAAARTAPQPRPETPTSDHLALVPASGAEGGTGSGAGTAGGTASGGADGLQQRLQAERGSLASLEQANADLASRARSLEDLADKSSKLLSLKDATIAELQQKLAAVQSGAGAPGPANAAAGDAGGAAATVPAAKPAVEQSSASATSWFKRPLTWIIAGLVALALILAGLLGRRRRDPESPVAERGPLPDPEDVAPPVGTAAQAAWLRARLADDPEDLDAHLALCRLYHAQGDVQAFVATAEVMHAHVHDPGSMEWHEVAVMGEELAPGDPLFAAPGEPQPVEADPPSAAPVSRESDEVSAGLAAWERPIDAGALPAFESEAAVPEETPQADGILDTRAAIEPESRPADDLPATGVEPSLPEEAQAEPDLELEPAWDLELASNPEPSPESESAVQMEAPEDADPKPFNDDPVDTKLDLARAYLDMGDPDGARAMLDEVIEEGSQLQKDEARRLLSETTS